MNDMTGASPPPEEAGNVSSKEPPVHPTCRKVFWAGAGFGWVVWVLAVAATSDEHWGKLPTGDTYGVGTRLVEDACDRVDFINSFCTSYENFAASQMVAAVLCTVAVILATVAFFRPFGAERGSSTTLGLASGVFMTLFAFCQILALLFFTKNVQELNNLIVGTYEAKPGDTYVVGITAFVCGLTQTAVTLALFRHAGHGPLLTCARKISAPDDVSIAPRTQTRMTPRKSSPPLLTINV